VLAICPIFAIYLPYVRAIAASSSVAAASVYRVSGGKWLWNIGGIEYPVFWAIACAAVAMHG
jgi:putative oxidoreductase